MPSRARKIEITSDSTQMALSSARPAKRTRAPRLLRVERPRLGDDRVWEMEVRALPAQLLAGLPQSTTLRLEIPGLDRLVAIATSAERAAAERDAGALVFDAMEWSALVSAAESDRLWPADLREICVRKLRTPRWSLEPEVALAGARADAPAGWTIGHVLDRIGAHLAAAEC
ncbi:MAG: hypothetical protein M3Y87_22055 [Myxococcota bacterium]|nr:hypothetical protein [Myxococcota bacterium]